MPIVPQVLARYHLDRRSTIDASNSDPVPRATGRATRSQTAITTQDPSELTEQQPLFFPHALPQDELDRCHFGLSEMEERLREGQLRSALDKVRVHLHMKARLIIFKNRNARGQGANTRANDKILANEAKIILAAEKYRAARAARMALNPQGNWKEQWPPLATADVRCMHEDDPTEGREPTEGRRTLSWIWRSADKSGGDAMNAGVKGMTDGMYFSYLS